MDSRVLRVKCLLQDALETQNEALFLDLVSEARDELVDVLEDGRGL